MAYKIAWTKRALKNYIQVIDYLESEWNEKVTNDFILKTKNVLDLLSEGNVTFKNFGKKGYYQVQITKHNNLVYRIGKEYIEIILIYDTRQHPLKKKI